jgi:hypothetical protein
VVDERGQGFPVSGKGSDADEETPVAISTMFWFSRKLDDEAANALCLLLRRYIGEEEGKKVSHPGSRLLQNCFRAPNRKGENRPVGRDRVGDQFQVPGLPLPSQGARPCTQGPGQLKQLHDSG